MPLTATKSKMAFLVSGSLLKLDLCEKKNNVELNER